MTQNNLTVTVKTYHKTKTLYQEIPSSCLSKINQTQNIQLPKNTTINESISNFAIETLSNFLIFKESGNAYCFLVQNTQYIALNLNTLVQDLYYHLLPSIILISLLWQIMFYLGSYLYYIYKH
ncbi:Hypothetical_protein [Hexamita inflata]|uniref:Hypothetical_protein n=1 Tax=Hexamita inflata TaxID=28002 RepID=A0AA86TMC6_9EUKA|nr:Hypothetical protein HINF_LOCUS7682 [Hexamita inflata]